MLTRRDLIIKWTTFGLASLLLLFVETLLLCGVRLFGVWLFLPPLVVGVVASMEGARAGMIFGLIAGVLCDLCIAAPFPCLYTISFTVAAFFCAKIARSVLQPGPLCSLAVSALTFLCVDLLQMTALFLKSRAALWPMLTLTLRETAASCLLLLAVHPMLSYLHRKFTI